MSDKLNEWREQWNKGDVKFVPELFEIAENRTDDVLDKELIREIIDYVEGTVIWADGEYGSCRTDFSEIEKDGDVEIPAFYYTLKNMLNEK